MKAPTTATAIGSASISSRRSRLPSPAPNHCAAASLGRKLLRSPSLPAIGAKSKRIGISSGSIYLITLVTNIALRRGDQVRDLDFYNDPYKYTCGTWQPGFWRYGTEKERNEPGAPGTATGLRRRDGLEAGDRNVLADGLFRYLPGQGRCRDRDESAEPLRGVQQQARALSRGARALLGDQPCRDA